MKTKSRKPDYEALRKILQKDMKRKVSKQEAKKIGRWVLNFYAHLGN